MPCDAATLMRFITKTYRNLVPAEESLKVIKVGAAPALVGVVIATLAFMMNAIAMVLKRKINYDTNNRQRGHWPRGGRLLQG
jgi:hypothetical protein